MSNCCRLFSVSVEKSPLKMGINCESHERVGFGRRLAVISCAWLCWICVRAALIAGLFLSAISSAWSSVISVPAGLLGRTAVGGVGVGAACAESWAAAAFPLATDELKS